MGEPLYQDVCSIFKEIGSDIPIVGGRYGLSSKDTTPGQIVSVFENLKQDKPKNNFTIASSMMSPTHLCRAQKNRSCPQKA